MILSYDYLWNNVRVKGGAYGCSSSFLRTGDSYFTSYRDPNLGKTNDVYNKIPDYIRNFKADEREMTKYIIGAVSAIMEDLQNSEKYHADRCTGYVVEPYHETRRIAYKVVLNVLNKTDFNDFLKEIEKEVNNG